MIKYIKTKAINFIANRFGVPQTALAYIKPMSVAGRQNKVGLPKDLVSLNVLNLMRGIYNRIVFDSHSKWVWPYWVEKQYDSKSLSFIPRGFQVPSINVSHRNWTALGNLYNEKEAIIDTRGLLTPRINSWSVDVFVVYHGELYAPSKLKSVKQRVLHSVPFIETTFEVANFVILITSFAEKIYDRDTLFHNVNVTNHGDQGDEITVHLSIRPYNPEGISLIHKISYRQNAFYVNGELGAVLMETPHQVICSNLKNGDASIFIRKDAYQSKHSSSCDAGLCNACAGYKMYLNPDEQKNLEFRIPMDKHIVIRKHFYWEGTHEKHKQLMLSIWKNKLQEGIRISIPDKKLEKAFKTNMSYLLLFFDGKSITPGPFNYHHFWFRDAAYLLNALIKCGYEEEAKEIILTYPSRQKISGYFLSQTGEWDSNGQAIWTVAEYYRITKDTETIRKVLPSIQSGANWIIRMLQKAAYKKVPHKGLMPIGLSAEHFGANEHYYWDNYWSLKGLMDAKYLLDEIPEEHINTGYIEKAINKLKVNIDESLEYANSKLKKPALPIGPSRYMDSACIGSLATIYPLRIFSPDDIRLVNTLDYLENHNFTNGAFFHDISHSGHGTYLNMHVVQCYLARRDPKAYELLQWMLNVSTLTFTWPESIHPFTFGGVIGDGHHGWAAADFLMAVRNMLFMEEQDVLVLTPVIPREWISWFETLSVENGTSYFGTINFSYEVNKENELDITINNQYVKPPKAIEINLPTTIFSIKIDDHIQEVNDTKFLISPLTQKLKVFFK